MTIEEEMVSMISHAKPNTKEESSDSNNNSTYSFPSYKRARTVKFKGVVPQPNRNWGAQIYANHQRIWLGTFKSESCAAMAYDSAAIKLRNGDSHRNFPLTNISILEANFQSHLTTDAVLNMIRDGSYSSKFADFLRSQQGEIEIGLNLSSIHGDGEFSCTLLFQKELTPSDVGKLNRLVIPKRYAVKHFPNVPDPDSNRMDQVQLEFYDREMSLWKFRYCYWKSSQSFVFTRGWNRFVKEKGLGANDVVAFYLYESRRERKSFIVIDVAGKEDDNGVDMEMGKSGDQFEEETPKEDDKFLLASSSISGAKGFKLFGVQILD